MNCRYTRVLTACSKMAADWQWTLSHHVTNTFPHVYHYVVHPDGTNVTHIVNCDGFLPGLDVVASWTHLMQICTRNLIEKLNFALIFGICHYSQTTRNLGLVIGKQRSLQESEVEVE